MWFFFVKNGQASALIAYWTRPIVIVLSLSLGFVFGRHTDESRR